MLCPECRAALHATAPCRVRPVPEPTGLPVVHAAAPYEGAVRSMLLAHKERGALTLAGPLGTALAGAVRAGLGDGVAGTGAGRMPVPSAPPVLLVPVPSARWAVRARGHDPMRRIALAAAGGLRRAGTAARVAAVLRQRRAVADQSGLNSGQRLANLAGALEVPEGCGPLLAGGRVVLVDDLMTTGASLAEAARAVRAALADPGMADPEAYARAARAATGERRTGWRTGRRPASAHGTRAPHAAAGRSGLGRGIRAAVVAASPDSFETNRN